MGAIIPGEFIEKRIYLIRNQKVMLSTDLAELYKVQPRALIQAVKRNINRFPSDFMFALSPSEHSNLKSQIVISSWGGSRTNPYAFTEQGVAMLSSVLKSNRAIQVNIAIMRSFVKLRQILSIHKELVNKFRELESKVNKHDTEIQTVFNVIKQIIAAPPPVKTKKRIGFYQD